VNLKQLKTQVDNAIESAGEYGALLEDIEVSLQIEILECVGKTKPYYLKDTIWSTDDVELHYDNNGDAAGCVLTSNVKIENKVTQ